jgi:hypothetical protein
VHAVLVFADLPESVRRQTLPLLVPNPAIKQPFMPYALAKDEACYAGEPVACVVADSRYIAEDAAQLVEVDYEPLPAVNDCRSALEDGAATAHVDSDSNVAARFPVKVGDTDRAFGGAKHIFREKIYQHRGGPFFIECRGAIASFEKHSASFTLHVSSQGSHRLKRCMLDMFDLGDNQVRVVTPDVGGGFGPQRIFLPGVRQHQRGRDGARASGEVDRGPAREFCRHASGARPVLGHGDRGRPQRQNPRRPWTADPRDRRVCAVGHRAAVDHRDDGARALRDSELQARRRLGFTNKIQTTPVRGAGARKRSSRWSG